MNKLLQMTLALLMAWSGCFCQVACGLEVCEHQHHAGEATCGDDSHRHHHHDDSEENEPSGCEHPKPSDRTLPDAPQLAATSPLAIQEVGEIVWPRVNTVQFRFQAYPTWVASSRGQASQAKLCRFVI